MNENTLIFPFAPFPKPRMTRRDAWWKTDRNARKAVIDYYAFKDELNFFAKKNKYIVSDKLSICFFVKMPDSWSKKKCQEMLGRAHQQKPDIDNFVKAFTDALSIKDEIIYYLYARKYWSEFARIEVNINA